jgi:hypothetical protein
VDLGGGDDGREGAEGGDGGGEGCGIGVADGLFYGLGAPGWRGRVRLEELFWR